MSVLFLDPTVVRLHGLYNHCRIRGVVCDFNERKHNEYDVIVSADRYEEDDSSIIITPSVWDAAVNASSQYSRSFLEAICGIETTDKPTRGLELCLSCIFTKGEPVNSWLSFVDRRVGAGSTGYVSAFPSVLQIYRPLSNRISTELFDKLCNGIKSLNDYSGIVHVSFSVPKSGNLNVFQLTTGWWNPLTIPFYELFPTDAVTTILSSDSLQTKHNYAMSLTIYAPPTCVGKTLPLNEKALKHAWPIAVESVPPYTILDDVVGYCTANGSTVEECKRRVIRNVNLSWRLTSNLLEDDVMYRSDVFRGASFASDFLQSVGVLEEPLAIYE